MCVCVGLTFMLDARGSPYYNSSPGIPTHADINTVHIHAVNEQLLQAVGCHTMSFSEEKTVY